MRRMVGDEHGVDRCSDASKDPKRIYMQSACIYSFACSDMRGK